MFKKQKFTAEDINALRAFSAEHPDWKMIVFKVVPLRKVLVRSLIFGAIYGALVVYNERRPVFVPYKAPTLDDEYETLLHN